MCERNAGPFLHERRRLFSFRRRDEVGRAALVVLAPSARVRQLFHRPAKVLFRGDCRPALALDGGGAKPQRKNEGGRGCHEKEPQKRLGPKRLKVHAFVLLPLDLTSQDGPSGVRFESLAFIVCPCVEPWTKMATSRARATG